jgi:hypothetical protein
MARFNKKNTSAKSSGLGKSSTPSNAAEISLTPEQETEITQLKEELALYQQRLNQTQNKQNTIKDILDNFEAVVVGDIILDILPDENSDEIINSPIISLTEVLTAINNADIGSGLSSVSVKSQLRNGANKIFQLNVIKLLIEQSTELETGELYLPLWYRSIDVLPLQDSKKDLFKEILRAIEIDLL